MAVAEPPGHLPGAAEAEGPGRLGRRQPGRPVSSGTAVTTTANCASAESVIAPTSTRNVRLTSTSRVAPGRDAACRCGRGQGSRSARACTGTVVTASRTASTTYVARQDSWPTSAAVSGAKTVLVNPATSVRVVRAATRSGGTQPVIAAKAGG